MYIRLLFVCCALSTLSVLGQDITFQVHPVNMAPEDDYVAAWAADMDEDGHTDLLALTSRELAYYPNKGNGTYGQAVLLDSTMGEAVAGLFIDLDGDGVRDVLVACMDDSTISWLRGLGGPGFAERAVLAHVQGTPSTLDAVDLNGDGELDLAACLQHGQGGSTALWWPNLGNGEFGPAETIHSIAHPNKLYDLAFGDTDNDGWPDVVVVTPSRVLVARNQGNGTFATAEAVIPFTSGTRKVVMLDIDGDGDLDMVVVFVSSAQAYQNDGTGSFTQTGPALTGMTSIKALAKGDFTGTGAKDIVFFNDLGAYMGCVLFTVHPSFNSTYTHFNIVWRDTDQGAGQIVDMNDDGTADLLFWSKRNIGYYPHEVLGETDQLPWPVMANTHIANGRVTTGRLRSPERRDIIVSHHRGLDYFPWDGTPDYGPQTRIIHTLGSRELMAFDDDQDGLDELFTCADSIIRFENTDSHLLQEQFIHAGPTLEFGKGDLDGNGLEDLIYMSRFDNNIGVAYRVGEAYVKFPFGAFGLYDPSNPRAEDMDGDGYADIVRSVRYGSSYSIYWHLNNTIGGFPGGELGGGLELPLGVGLKSVFTTGKFNEDERVDFVAQAVVGGADVLVALVHPVGGGPWPAQVLSPEVTVTKLLTADLNLDGHQDVIGFNRSGSGGPWIWLGNGDGTFSVGEQLPSPLDVLTDFALGDLDGDGDLDIVAAGGGGGSVFWYENETNALINAVYRGPDDNPGMHLFPNPCSSTCLIRLADGVHGNGEFTLYAMDGRRVETKIAKLDNAHVLDVSHLSPGSYMLVLAEQGALVTRSKLIVAR